MYNHPWTQATRPSSTSRCATLAAPERGSTCSSAWIKGSSSLKEMTRLQTWLILRTKYSTYPPTMSYSWMEGGQSTTRVEQPLAESQIQLLAFVRVAPSLKTPKHCVKWCFGFPWFSFSRDHFFPARLPGSLVELPSSPQPQAMVARRPKWGCV